MENLIFVLDLLWEGSVVDSPSVIYEDGVYHMFYHGQSSIGHAWSVDGIDWTKDQNPVLTPGPDWYDSRRVMNPYVLNVNGTYYMYYTAQGNDGILRTGLATSSDPLTGPVITQTPTPTTTPTPTIEPTATLTPTPTPTVTPPSGFSPIIVAVGMFASWNPRDILSCDVNQSNTWGLVPFLKKYDRLVKTLTKNAGLKLNDDVFIYTYDWRQPLTRQDELLKNYIDEILSVKTPGTKVQIIGHSFGGLAARSYLESYSGQDNVYKTITVGTPHQGTLLSYPAWAGGEILEKDKLHRLVFDKLLHHCGRKISRRETVQRIVPSVRQLLPIFPYLRKNGTEFIPSTPINQNDWLGVHPFPSDGYNTILASLSGDNVATMRYFDVVDPTPQDILAGNWFYGKPVL